MTLAFLGDVPDNDLNTVCKAVAEGVPTIFVFRAAAGGRGRFPQPVRGPACFGPA